ncbi:MAG: hypothetical protein JWN37_562 [Candidatus Nomurabacteria bacterium]|nr:hypothetical protein [Candidatus Nomurabacteria bacterium]
MKHVFIKKSHVSHLMDGKEYESKSYIKHDFMHLAYLKVMKNNEGFFASKTNPMREESIIGALQGGAQRLKEEGGINYDELLNGINMMLEINGFEKIKLPEENMRDIYKEYGALISHWDHMKTGEEFVIEA